jgi:pheromone shutdown-related protein TraB
MTNITKNIVDIDENLRLLGTAHVSKTSVELVREQIRDFKPDIIAVELCESRLSALKKPEGIDNEDLLKIISDGKAGMIFLQSALSVQQRKMGIDTGEKPGAELLAAINIAEEEKIPFELIDRNVVITLRRAWHSMGFFEKFRVFDALLSDENDDDFDLEELLEDSDLLSNMMEDVYLVAPNAGKVLIDERDEFLTGRIQQIRGKGKVLAVVGAGHLKGIQLNLKKPSLETTSKLNSLNEQPKKPSWPKYLMTTIPIFLALMIGKSVYEGDISELFDSISIWLILNSFLAGLGVLVARGHPMSILVGAIASPITSLNPSLAAGWFAGYTQLKMAPPTGKDAYDFLEFSSLFNIFFKNKVGRVLMVTIFGNLGSSVGSILAIAMISSGFI